MINLSPILSDPMLLILRCALAAIFLVHGWPKIKNLKGTAEWFASIGFRPGMFWAPIVAVTETLGAFLIIAGLGVRLAAIPIAIDMLVAMTWKIRSGQKLRDGYELDLILLTVALFLAANGGGFYSLDSYWNWY